VGVSQDGDTYTFGYNGLGDRLQQAVNGAPTSYTLDLNTGLTQVLAEETSTYLYGNGRVGEQKAGGWQYHLPDASNSIRQLIDLNATIVLSQSFEPYGSIFSSVGAVSSKYGFVCEWTDQSGFMHLRDRYYAPEWGRFFARDPWRGGSYRPVSLHPYLYAKANPIRYSDSPGRCYGEFDFLRNYERQNCENLDMDFIILASPQATNADKRWAGAYVGAWGISHLYLGAGVFTLTAINPFAAAEGIMLGGGYSAYQYEMAASGKCGCEAQQWALSMDKGRFIRQGMYQGAAGGGIFAGTVGLGPWGKIATGAGGAGLSGYGMYTSRRDIINQGVNPCNAMNFGLSTVGMGLSGLVIRQGVNALRTTSLPSIYRLPKEGEFFRRYETGHFKFTKVTRWLETGNLCCAIFRTPANSGRIIEQV
jgi:RHS repeat-associated protein